MKGKITITKCNDKKIRIRIRDNISRIEFVEIELSLESFAQAVTGLAEVEGDLEVNNLQFVGKYKVVENREIICPLDGYDYRQFKQWLINNAQEEGWILDTYLGSRGSISSTYDGKTLLRYSVIKYIDKE